MRQQGIVRAREEIEALTTEKTRLNLLRDANHRFVENACHDFRSPLTVIKEFAAIIAEGLAGDVNEEQAGVPADHPHPRRSSQPPWSTGSSMRAGWNPT